MRLIQIDDPKELGKIMQDIEVDPCGIDIMCPKGVSRLLRINSISCIAANILKQEMLSLGGDAAVARDALTGKTKKTDCLLIGNLSQFDTLTGKLNKQPFGLDKMARDVSRALDNYQKDKFRLEAGHYKLDLSRRTHLMGIVNLTPDSFSQDGLYPSAIDRVIQFIEKMAQEGADIIDIGGESSRPGARPVSLKEELKRTIPVIKKIARRIKIPISIDTYKPQVAAQALDNGAVIVNDITGLRNDAMLRAVSRYKAGVVIMHMKRNPETMQKNPVYKSLLDEIISYLDRAAKRAVCAGVSERRIIIDPGIGFGKTLQHNLEILKHLREFKILGYPIMVGTSRKSFLGSILNLPVQERIFGTVSTCVWAANNGANILRVHDVKEVRQALMVLDKIRDKAWAD